MQGLENRIEEPLAAVPDDAAQWRRLPPPPLHGGVFTLLRFMATHHMAKPMYLRALWRLFRHKYLSRYGSRIELDGLAFIGKRVHIEIGTDATLKLGRWCWIGNDTKIRVHGGAVEIGAKSVLGEEITFSAYEHISIGRECVVADRVMLIDFDHCMMEVERPIRQQGIYSRPVTVGNNVWVGYGACFLRGTSTGDNSVVGTLSVVTKDIPANAVAGGIPARTIRMREAPRLMSWE